MQKLKANEHTQICRFYLKSRNVCIRARPCLCSTWKSLKKAFDWPSTFLFRYLDSGMKQKVR